MFVKQFGPTNQGTGGKHILPVRDARYLPIRTTKDLFLGLLETERAIVGSGAQQPKFSQNEAVVRAERARGLTTSQKTNSRNPNALCLVRPSVRTVTPDSRAPFAMKLSTIALLASTSDEKY